MCSFRFHPRMTLRGLCENEWTDVFYSLVWDEGVSMPYYRGDTGTIIRYEEDRGLWRMVAGNVTGTAVTSILPMGTGAVKWNLDRDICNRNSLEPFSALMTVCSVRLSGGLGVNILTFCHLRGGSLHVTAMESVFQWKKGIL